MAKDETKNVGQTGGNITVLKEHVAKGVKQIEGLKSKRADINAKIQEVRTSLEAEGIPKKCLDMAMQYMNMDPDKREGFDIAYTIVREAIGLPVQGDLFSTDDDKSEGGE